MKPHLNTFLSLWVLLWVFHSVPAIAQEGESSQAPTWVFFDLGNVIVDTRDWSHVHYATGARDYLQHLRQQNYRIGLIVNIPENFGSSCQTRFTALQAFLRKVWQDETEFDWSLADMVILPPSDALAKPHGYMFLSALEVACPGRALFQGEEAIELLAAESLGYATYRVDIASSAPFLPFSEIEQHVTANYHTEHPDRCDYVPSLRQVVAPYELEQIEPCRIPMAP